MRSHRRTVVDHPVVSVVIPTHNRGHLIGRALASVQSQTFTDWECLVVDDASEDDTRGVVEGFGTSRIRYLRHEENQGGAAARNTGIDSSVGKFVAFLDSDDRWEPTVLENQLERFRTSDLPDVGMVYVGATGIYPEGRVLRYPAMRRGWLFDDLLRSNVVGSTSGAMVRRDVLDQVGGFDEDLPARQDVDLWLRIARQYPIDCVQECLLRKYEEAGEARIGTDFRAKVEARARFLAKHENDLKRAGVAHRLLYENGRYSHVQLRDRQAARDWYRRALEIRPWFVKGYLRWAQTFLPLPWKAPAATEAL